MIKLCWKRLRSIENSWSLVTNQRKRSLKHKNLRKKSRLLKIKKLTLKRRQLKLRKVQWRKCLLRVQMEVLVKVLTRVLVRKSKTRFRRLLNKLKKWNYCLALCLHFQEREHLLLQRDLTLQLIIRTDILKA